MIGLLIGTHLEKSKGVPFVGIKKEKAIGLYTGTSPFNTSPSSNIVNPILSTKDITDTQAEYVTDPFVVKEGPSWYMFFGVRKLKTKRAAIGLATSDDGFKWRYQRIVLDEPFHTSYPYIIKWEEEYYMVPESEETNAIRLYMAHDFPDNWIFVKTLLKGNYVDPAIFRFDGRWWMFVESNPHGHDRLSLFFANELEGPWAEHPMSPVINGNGHIARPGGRVIRFENRLIRFTQDDEPYYGNKLWAFEITALSPTHYEERPVGDHPVLREGKMSWNNKGIHHIDLHQIDQEQWLAFVSGHGETLAFGLDY